MSSINKSVSSDPFMFSDEERERGVLHLFVGLLTVYCMQ
jgi:hypothetical protein